MPPGTAEFAVSHDIEAGFFLLFHTADDFSVFDFARLFCRNLTRRSLQAGLLHSRRPQRGFRPDPRETAGFFLEAYAMVVLCFAVT